MGYNDFQTGWLRFMKENNTIIAMVEPISEVQKGKSSSKIEQVRYTFYTGK